ncbi:hypothetical protein ABZX92_38435 [Lentzea sp. NPDC006480]|uniref:hypothetical protein n=1 Tax=Lentzea sp. NPDC006480 TaxID=3157176 RepID=UPI0033A27863
MRKVLLAFAMLLTMVTPAEAFEPCYLWGRQVFGITAEGGLVEHSFCLDANRSAGVTRWSGQNVVATSGWGDVSAVFWSGEKYSYGVYYRVVGSGLFWSADLRDWQQIGIKTDWSKFTSLTSAAPGVIYGTEFSGAVHRWEHLGWQDGTNSWGPETVAARMPVGSVLRGHSRDGFIADTGTVNIWSDTFTKSKIRLTVPDGVEGSTIAPFDLAERYPNSAFALTTSGSKLVLLLPGTCAKLERPWLAGDEIGGGYTSVFVGGWQKPRGTGPVEWQCDGPPGGAN